MRRPRTCLGWRRARARRSCTALGASCGTDLEWRLAEMTGTEERRISSLHDLPQEIAPARDLWQGIEARIIAEQGAVVERGARPRAGRVARLRIFAAAAVIAALAVGI